MKQDLTQTTVDGDKEHMILVSNVKITNDRLSPVWRGNCENHDRFYVWLYTLASYSKFNSLLSKVVLNVELSDEFRSKKNEAEEFIYSIFPENILSLKWERNQYKKDWIKTTEADIFPVNDNIILNANNDDHVFIDSNLDLLTDSIRVLEVDQDPYAQVIYSHWPEMITISYCTKWIAEQHNSFVTGKEYRIFCGYDNMDILKKERWAAYWFSGPADSRDICFRTEGVRWNTGIPRDHTVYVPLKEMFRHFDGYHNYYFNTNPPIDIPKGFFDKDIKISYGYNFYKPGWININPDADNLLAYDKNGADYKFSLEDIPLCWKDRISEIDINPECDLEYLREKRDEYFYECSTQQFPSRFGLSVYQLAEYLEPHPRSLYKKFFVSNKYKNIIQ